jgi:hypothetical protein
MMALNELNRAETEAEPDRVASKKSKCRLRDFIQRGDEPKLVLL